MQAPPPGYYGPPPKKTQVGADHRAGASASSCCWPLPPSSALALLGKGTVTATDVKVGDCLAEIPASTRVLTVQTVDCDQSHAGEVFAVLTMPEGDFPGAGGDRGVPEQVRARSWPTTRPSAMTDDSVQLYVLYPTAETWEQGDRAVTCVATLDPPRTGSIKG